MRVLIVTCLFPPNVVGGYEVACASFARHLLERGHDVRVLAARHPLPPGASPLNEPDVLRELDWYKHDDLSFRPVSFRDRLTLEARNVRTLRRRLRQFAPDVVNWWAMGGMSLSSIEVVRRAGIPSVGMVSDEWMVYGAQVDAWMRGFRRHPHVGRAVERLTGIPTTLDLATAAEWVFVSEYLRARVAEQGVRLARTAIGRTGIDTDRLHATPFRERFTGTLAYVGRVDRVKGVDVAVRALAELPDDHRLRVVGGGERAYASELRELSAAKGVAGRVRFEPPLPREQLSTVYGDADVVVFPVRWDEPWGLVPLEAMACGTPVLATGTGGSREYLRDEENCVLVPRDDPGSLAHAVRRLAADPDLRRRIRAAGIETSRQYGERRCNELFERHLCQAVDGPPSS
jgi:glycosyltransferase involved in cell wall biosynthesis